MIDVVGILYLVGIIIIFLLPVWAYNGFALPSLPKRPWCLSTEQKKLLAEAENKKKLEDEKLEFIRQGNIALRGIKAAIEDTPYRCELVDNLIKAVEANRNKPPAWSSALATAFSPGFVVDFKAANKKKKKGKKHGK